MERIENSVLECFARVLSKEIIPQHIGIIMDGNTRWATKNNLSRQDGHKAGGKALERIINACLYFKISTLTLYVFSTENWQREKKEVDDLMELLQEYSKKYLPSIEKKDICFRFLGDFTLINKDIRENLQKTINNTKQKTGMTLCMAINYGGRDEIVRATEKIVQDNLKNKIKKTKITKKEFANYLDTAGLADVDLIIRTSGEQRISNFLLWQSAYAEFYFCKTLWPDFDEWEFFLALMDFARRNRTKGYYHQLAKN